MLLPPQASQTAEAETRTYYSNCSLTMIRGVLRDEEETRLLGKTIASIMEKNDLVCLRGELGSGKTTFARAFISALNKHPVDVTSPTFALLQTYESPKGTIWHFDLYRLRSPDELLELGLEEALQYGITLIEWPELAEKYLPPSRMDITFSYAEDTMRQFQLEAHGAMIPRMQPLNLSQYFSIQ